MDKTIFILANSIGGLYSFRKEVVKALADAGYNVVISAPHDSHEKEDFFFSIGCQMEFVEVDRRGTNPLRDLALVWRYRSLIRELRPAAVLTYTIKPNIYGGLAARLCHVPQLANITGLGDAIENPGLLQKLSIFLYRVGLKKAWRVFYQNSSIEAFCKAHRIGRNGQLLPGSGVNLEWHTFQPYPVAEAPLRFNFIGRMMKDKGLEELLAMAIDIRSRYPQVEFHLFGHCEERYEDILKASQEQGVLVWHGAVSDVRPWIKDSCCTVHPSYHEGMANVLLESCAAGRPVIASDIPGCREAVDDGETGFLCQVRDAADLTAKVERFINLPHEAKRAMGAAARRKVEREFDRKIIVDAYLKALNEATNNSHR